MSSREPLFTRGRLRDRLRSAREASGLTQREVAEEMEWSTSKIIRIEAGRVGIAVNDIRALLPLYGISDPGTVADFVQLARLARMKSHAWWEEYREFTTPQFRTFLSYENSATLIRNYEPRVVPGLLQIEDYTREISRNLFLENDPKREKALLDLRAERQARVLELPEKELHFILDQSVICRAAELRSTMRRQLRHLLDLMDDQRVKIRVVPFSRAAYRLFNKSYVIFEFPDGGKNGNALYIERSSGMSFITREDLDSAPHDETPSYFLEAFWGLEQDVSKESTTKLLQNAMRDF
ncbi:transcriptional regulator [Streptomyces camponoticapitis]|uniref:Transcriptional regulator n=1 Tax=Streptomyces camponoticapitis TaxID=1616125 RepID=A0ABQ2E2I2_9ACTN|nr:helix-turn-helix transcriptional regulator [Streptomyces camponoticapitis]GGJ83102.1 transcriptional regulator [Streptomyces camponoticapitis]